MTPELTSVQCKVHCIFDVIVDHHEPSEKHPEQGYTVSASQTLTTKVDVVKFAQTCSATEKLDGTCCYADVDRSRGDGKFVYRLYARFDRKPNKATEKLFKVHMAKSAEERIIQPFIWKSLEEDFKPIPDTWMPNKLAEYDSGGEIAPDQSGHIIGWVPVLAQPQYKWHASALDYSHDDGARILTLRQGPARDTLVLGFQFIEEFTGKTFELIGTHINGNAYRIGTKKSPFHVYLQHGILKVNNVPNITCDDPKQRFTEWFAEDKLENKVEGIVWHGNNKLMKLHRGHIKLKWPISNEKLNLHRYKVRVEMSLPTVSSNNSMLNALYSLNGKIFDSILDISY